jgi:hypothetical protein
LALFHGKHYDQYLSRIATGDPLMIVQSHPEEFVSIGLRLALLVGLSFIILIFQRLLQVILGKSLVKSKRISLDMINSLKLVIRFSSLISIFYLALVLFEYSIESIFGFSAVLGAIITFGSVQWISNFIAGIYLLILRPFSIKDFIELSDEIRGTVDEISLNYTKIKTVNGVYHHIPNRIIIRSNLKLFYGKRKRIVPVNEEKKPDKDQPVQVFLQIARYLIEERIIRYTFLWGAPLGDLKTTKKKILEICEIYAGVFGYKPEYYLESLGHRMNFKFIVSTLNVRLLERNIHDFRNDLSEVFH